MSKNTKTQYVNVFILCSEADVIGEISKAMDRLCVNIACTYNITQSKIIDRFFYVRIHPLDTEKLENVKKSLPMIIEEFRDFISWYKIETVEVR
ncbi:MAG: hypothetical protein N3D82_05535 [Ignisphaera sp.]|nr:hypothetical protein [Ignisphaera sp.]MCX8168467.1 hypothetical protein [Ignisphaera sp.]MDW8085093.1 hypothetical protein [Ignisphaera sp.]